jgi:hypothetical protein
MGRRNGDRGLHVTLSIKFRRIDIADEDQVNPTHVDVSFSVHTDQADVASAKGTDEVGRFVARCTSTRAAAQALLNTCHIVNNAQIPAAVMTLLQAAGLQFP